ncbi:uncharacterized protein [Rutidosis leptorrhynchoides]|uniref:uncharacterized protein n=1 Tax=Rutidosis leptorrhynchoides TaxID=125765 RepID=UPI003A994646
MISLTSWNVRGLNLTPKQNEVLDVVQSNQLCACAILESHVAMDKLNKIGNVVFPNWSWSSNVSACKSDQVVHCQVCSVNGDCNFFVSFVYAANLYIDRRPLWQDCLKHNVFIGMCPWVIMGDFNASLNIEEFYTGVASTTIAMREFKECVDSLCMTDVNHSGLQYTWNQRPKTNDGILKKIDRVMANDVFIEHYTNAFAIFQPYRISDHSPSILKIPSGVTRKHGPFRFSNYITNHCLFQDTVSECWNQVVQGQEMFKVVMKLRGLKKPLRKLMWMKGNLHDRVIDCRLKLEQAQKDLDIDPRSVAARINATVALNDFNDAVVKGRTNRTRIQSITDANGLFLEGLAVPKIFVDHYKVFLGQAESCVEINTPASLFNRTVDSQKAMLMTRPVSNQEVKDAIFIISDSKSPGPDGYTAAFFKKAWDTIGGDITRAVQEFFVTGQMLKEINCTIITLLPKVHTHSKVTDYRPISCCNVLYKCISKIIVSRIKSSLDDIININQSAFVPGRNITDNILLTQELMRNYHLNRGTPRCAFKVDIQKAYDTVDWEFLNVILICFGFPSKMVDWIMKCVSSTSYLISINGELHGFFKGKCGLRQGDHDLFLFTHASLDSISVIRDSLEEFKACSGLSPSLPKSIVFFLLMFLRL